LPRAVLYILLTFFITLSHGVKASQHFYAYAAISQSAVLQNPDKGPSQNTAVTQHDQPAETEPILFQAATPQAPVPIDPKSILILFLQGIFVGILAVFTPYVYKIHPFTTGYLTRNIQSARSRWLRVFAYAGSLILIFTLLGLLATLIIKFTGLQQFTEHWIFNLFFFRIFLTLGLLFLGAFALKLPAKWINAISAKAQSNSLMGIFIMASTLPLASFSSTFPIVGLVLVLAGNVPTVGPLIGMFGFGIGLAIPFVFPAVISIFAKSKSMLNNINVIMGFLSLMLALKFVSKADISLGLHLIDRDMFIIVWVGIWGIMGLYMLGLLKLSHDTESEINLYGIEYIPLSRLFIAIFAFVFALYLLPGVWGAPLPGVNGFLPNF
jgi:thiol:disulfide interchange protein